MFLFCPIQKLFDTLTNIYFMVSINQSIFMLDLKRYKNMFSYQKTNNRKQNVLYFIFSKYFVFQ